MELIHSTTVPSVEDNETQMGGSVNTRSMKHERVEQESPRQNDKEKKVKKRKTDDRDMSELLDDGLDQSLMERAKRLEMQMNPQFRADLVLMPYKRRPLKGAVKKNNSPLPLNNEPTILVKNP